MKREGGRKGRREKEREREREREKGNEVRSGVSSACVMVGHERRRNLQSIMMAAEGRGGEGRGEGRAAAAAGGGGGGGPSTHCVTIPRHARPTRPKEPGKPKIVM